MLAHTKRNFSVKACSNLDFMAMHAGDRFLSKMFYDIFFQFFQSVGGGNEVRVKDQLYFNSKMLLLPVTVP